MRHGTWSKRVAGLALWLLLGPLGFQVLGRIPEEEALFTLAVRAYQDGLLNLARDQLQKYVVAYPQGKRLADVHYLLGDYFYRKGEPLRAAEHLQQALRRGLAGTTQADARYLLGRSHFDNGRYGEAVQVLQPLIEQGHAGGWYEAAQYWTGEAMLSSGDFEAAAGVLQRLVERSPTSEYLEHALYSLGYAWQKLEAHERALQAFQEVLHRFPQSKLRRSAAYGVARALVSLRRYDAAAPHWERLREEASTPDQAEEATFWWAESWARAGRCERARPAFEAYAEQFPNGRQYPEALEVIGECAYAARDFAAAISRFETWLQRLPSHPRREIILLRLAHAHYQEGQLTKAEQLYAHWLEAFPHSPRRAEVLLQHGLIGHFLQDYTRSAEDFAEALRGPHDAAQARLAHEMLAEIYVRRQDCTAARPHLSAVIEHGTAPARQQARWQRGSCAYQQQEYGATVEDLSPLAEAEDFRGDRQTLLRLLGESLAALDRHVEAIARFRQFLAADPSGAATTDVLARLGASLLKAGQVEEALPVYEQLLTLVPEGNGKERLHLQLGLLYRAQLAQEKVKQHLRAAAEGVDQSSAAEALYLLADVLLQEGAGEEASALLRRLTTQFASQARWVGIAHYRLALFYEQAQGWPKAWEAYMAAAETATDPKLVEAARERAKHLEEAVDVHRAPEK